MNLNIHVLIYLNILCSQNFLNEINNELALLYIIINKKNNNFFNTFLSYLLIYIKIMS
jgi:hypothetical protein